MASKPPSILNTTKNTIIAKDTIIADTMLSRMTGLLNRQSLPEGEALIIKGCTSIHMFFMRFSIDVIFVDKNDIVIGLVECIKPFRLSPIFFHSRYAIEIPEGTIKQAKVEVGDKIKIDAA